jgi:hypothetical protein
VRSQTPSDADAAQEDSVDVLVRKDTPIPAIMGQTAAAVRYEVAKQRDTNAPVPVEMDTVPIVDEETEVEVLLPADSATDTFVAEAAGAADEYEVDELLDDFFGSLAELDDAALFGESRDYARMSLVDAIAWFAYWPAFLDLYDGGDTKLLAYLTDPYHIPQLMSLLNYPAKLDGVELESGTQFDEVVYEQALPRMSAFILTGSSTGPTLSSIILQDASLLHTFFWPVVAAKSDVSLRSEWSSVFSYLVSKSIESGELLNYMYWIDPQSSPRPAPSDLVIVAPEEQEPPALAPISRGAAFVKALISKGHLANEHIVALLRSLFTPSPAGYGDHWLQPLIQFGFVEQLQQRLHRLSFLPIDQWDHVHALEMENIRDVVIISNQIDALAQAYLSESFTRELIRHIFTPRVQHEPHPIALTCMDVLLTLLEPLVNERAYMIQALPPALSCLVHPFDPVDYSHSSDLTRKITQEESHLAERLQHIGISPGTSPNTTGAGFLLSAVESLNSSSNSAGNSSSGSNIPVDDAFLEKPVPASSEASPPGAASSAESRPPLRIAPLALNQISTSPSGSGSILQISPRLKSPRRSPRARASSRSSGAPGGGVSSSATITAQPPPPHVAPVLPPMEALARYLSLPTLGSSRNSSTPSSSRPAPLGTFRLKCVSLVRALLNCNYGVVHEKIMQQDLLTVLLDLMFAHPSANILHHLVRPWLEGKCVHLFVFLFVYSCHLIIERYKHLSDTTFVQTQSILADFFYLENQTMVVDWLRRGKVLEKLLDVIVRFAPAAGSELSGAWNAAPAYMPYVYQLCYKIQSVSKMSPEMGTFVSAHESWPAMEEIILQKKDELDKPFADKVALRLASPNTLYMLGM